MILGREYVFQNCLYFALTPNTLGAKAWFYNYLQNRDLNYIREN